MYAVTLSRSGVEPQPALTYNLITDNYALVVLNFCTYISVTFVLIYPLLLNFVIDTFVLNLSPQLQYILIGNLYCYCCFTFRLFRISCTQQHCSFLSFSCLSLFSYHSSSSGAPHFTVRSVTIYKVYSYSINACENSHSLCWDYGEHYSCLTCNLFSIFLYDVSLLTGSSTEVQKWRGVDGRGLVLTQDSYILFL